LKDPYSFFSLKESAAMADFLKALPIGSYFPLISILSEEIAEMYWVLIMKER
jgi:hypothetical protein